MALLVEFSLLGFVLLLYLFISDHTVAKALQQLPAVGFNNDGDSYG